MCSATTTRPAKLLSARSRQLRLCARGSSCVDSGARRRARGGDHHGDPRADGHVVVRLAPARHVRPDAANGGLLGDRLPLLRGALFRPVHWLNEARARARTRVSLCAAGARDRLEHESGAQLRARALRQQLEQTLRAHVQYSYV